MTFVSDLFISSKKAMTSGNRLAVGAGVVSTAADVRQWRQNT
jgi:hypothetical protein